jgi:hypothetical protein
MAEPIPVPSRGETMTRTWKIIVVVILLLILAVMAGGLVAALGSSSATSVGEGLKAGFFL